ncbi:kinase-like domain-containing protein [Earliella scabrosa]|nr:kinase-like domain-containing protein [Earliella scabrosa]
MAVVRATHLVGQVCLRVVITGAGVGAMDGWVHDGEIWMISAKHRRSTNRTYVSRTLRFRSTYIPRRTSEKNKHEALQTTESFVRLYVHNSLIKDSRNSNMDAHYEVAECVGVGRTGPVRRAFDHRGGRAVAVKTFEPRSSQNDRESLANEEHMLFMQVLDSVTPPKGCYLVFPLLGMSLADALEMPGVHPLPDEHTRWISLQVIEAVEFLHSMRVVHTDLKPANIMLKSAEREEKALPQGRSQTRSAVALRLCRPGHGSGIIGTSAYRAPEVTLGLPWTRTVDLFGTGCIIAEVLSGQPLLPATLTIQERLASMEQVLGGSIPEMLVLASGEAFRKFFRRTPEGNYQVLLGRNNTAAMLRVRKIRAARTLKPSFNWIRASECCQAMPRECLAGRESIIGESSSIPTGVIVMPGNGAPSMICDIGKLSMSTAQKIFYGLCRPTNAKHDPYDYVMFSSHAGAYNCWHLCEDWPRHSGECSRAALINARVAALAQAQAGAMGQGGFSVLPPIQTVVGMLADPDHDNIRFIDVRLLRSNFSINRVVCPIPLLFEFFRYACASIPLNCGADGHPLLSPYDIYYCTHSFASGRNPNRAIALLTKGAAPQPPQWPGPVIVLKYCDTTRMNFTNFHSSDLANIRAYFANFR